MSVWPHADELGSILTWTVFLNSIEAVVAIGVVVGSKNDDEILEQRMIRIERQFACQHQACFLALDLTRMDVGHDETTHLAAVHRFINRSHRWIRQEDQRDRL